MAVAYGSLVLNKLRFIEVDSNPNVAPGIQSDMGSIAVVSNGTAWIKFGPAATDWSKMDSIMGDDWNLQGNTLTGAGPDDPNEFMGSVNDFDVVFKRNNLELFRFADANTLEQVINRALNPSLAQSMMFKTTSIGAAGAVITIPVPSNFNGLIVTRIIGRQSAGVVGAVGDAVSYVRTTTVSNTAGVVTKLFEENDDTFEVDPAFDLNSAGVAGNLVFTITTVADRNFSWGARAELELIAL